MDFSLYFVFLVIPFKFLRVMVFFVDFFYTFLQINMLFFLLSLRTFVSKVKVCLAKIYAIKKKGKDN